MAVQLALVRHSKKVSGSCPTSKMTFLYGICTFSHEPLRFPKIFHNLKTCSLGKWVKSSTSFPLRLQCRCDCEYEWVFVSIFGAATGWPPVRGICQCRLVLPSVPVAITFKNKEPEDEWMDVKSNCFSWTCQLPVSVFWSADCKTSTANTSLLRGNVQQSQGNQIQQRTGTEKKNEFCKFLALPAVFFSYVSVRDLTLNSKVKNSFTSAA